MVIENLNFQEKKKKTWEQEKLWGGDLITQELVILGYYIKSMDIKRKTK